MLLPNARFICSHCRVSATRVSCCQVHRPSPTPCPGQHGVATVTVAPEHAWLRDLKRVEYTYATDPQALNAFTELARLEGIIPALESAHAVAEVIRRAPGLPKEQIIIINLSGRGDNDAAQAARFIQLR